MTKAQQYRVWVAVAGLVLALAAAAYAMHGQVVQNTVRVEMLERSIQDVRREVHDLWKLHFEDRKDRR